MPGARPIDVHVLEPSECAGHGHVEATSAPTFAFGQQFLVLPADRTSHTRDLEPTFSRRRDRSTLSPAPEEVDVPFVEVPFGGEAAAAEDDCCGSSPEQGEGSAAPARAE